MLREISLFAALGLAACGLPTQREETCAVVKVHVCAGHRNGSTCRVTCANGDLVTLERLVAVGEAVPYCKITWPDGRVENRCLHHHPDGE